MKKHHLTFFILLFSLCLYWNPQGIKASGEQKGISVAKTVQKEDAAVSSSAKNLSLFHLNASAADLQYQSDAPLESLVSPQDPQGDGILKIIHLTQSATLQTLSLIILLAGYAIFGVLLLTYHKGYQHPFRSLVHWISFFLHHPAKTFSRFAPVVEKKIWAISFHRYKQYHRLAQGMTFFGIILLVAKFSALTGITLYLLNNGQAQSGVGNDDGAKVHPLDTLTYRVDWHNISGEKKTEVQVHDSLPEGASYKGGSLTIQKENGENETDYSLQVSGKQIHGIIPEINDGQKGYFTYQVTVDLPSTEEKITGQAVLSDLQEVWSSNITENVIESGSIGDLIWQDDDRNREKDESEKGLADVEIKLYHDPDHSQDFNAFGDRLIASTKTDAAGHYDFTGLGKAAYWLVIDEKTLPEKATFTLGKNPRQIDLVFSSWVSLEHSGDFNGSDFGIFAEETVSQPQTESVTGIQVQPDITKKTTPANKTKKEDTKTSSPKKTKKKPSLLATAQKPPTTQVSQDKKEPEKTQQPESSESINTSQKPVKDEVKTDTTPDLTVPSSDLAFVTLKDISYDESILEKNQWDKNPNQPLIIFTIMLLSGLSTYALGNALLPVAIHHGRKTPKKPFPSPLPPVKAKRKQIPRKKTGTKKIIKKKLPAKNITRRK